MGSAYAALVSLMNLLDIIKHPKNPVSYPLLVKSQIQSLFEKVNSLVQLLETHSNRISKDLETKMTDAAFAAEDTIESYAVEEIKKSRSTPFTFHVQKSTSAAETSRPLLSLDLDKAFQEMKLSIHGAVRAKQNDGEQDQLLSKDFQKKMTNAAHEAEDMIETDLVESRSNPFTFQAQTSRPLAATGIQTHPKRKTVRKKSTSAAETSLPPFSLDLDKEIQEMDLIIQEVVQAKQNNGEQDQLQSKGLAPVVDSTAVPRPVKVVGLKEETNCLIDQLTSRQSDRQIIPIVGMGGLGKTTLATSVYNHPHLKRHFDVKAWVTISQVYTPRTIFAPLLHDIGVNSTDQIEDAELGLRLHKGLMGRTYLIVIDDIWDVGAWDELNRFCPDNNNGSRILLTTRVLDVANRVSSYSPFELQLLDVDRSWDLLSKTVFDHDGCPTELQNCGNKIAENCKGLPLAIVVIGGLLKESDQTQDRWEHVQRNTRSIIGMEDNDHCMKILSLSYHQLPIHLKPCFLYLATFPEDTQIKISWVTKLWVADGFLKPTMDGKTLDKVASECLKDLARRNLVIVSKQNRRGQKKCLTVHDLVRDLCVKEAQKEKFVYVDDGLVTLPNSIEGQRRVVVHENECISYGGMQQKGLSRSFIWFKNEQRSPPEISRLSLLRVLLFHSYWVRTSRAGIQPFNLRFLKLSIERDQSYLLSSICWALNLDTLILDGVHESYRLPVEIWKLWRLKHLIYVDRWSKSIILPDPPAGSDFVLENLQTLKRVTVLSDIVLDRIPNIKSMRIHYDHDYKMEPPPCFDNLVHCHKLEKLSFEVMNLNRASFENYYEYPSYLKKLSLNNTKIPWEKMTIVGALPNLEFLDLRSRAFIGQEWDSVEGEFEKLIFLRIYDCNDLVRWTVEEASHFPSLEQLVLVGMFNLEEIPLVFGELMPLVSIKMYYCSDSVKTSARQIREEHRQGGNSGLIVDMYPD